MQTPYVGIVFWIGLLCDFEPLAWYAIWFAW